MNYNCQNMVIIFLGVLVLWLLLSPYRNSEMFDPNVCQFVPQGDQRHDLRGYPIRSSSVDHLYRPDKRYIRLNDTCGEMYKSTQRPSGNCRDVPCPVNDEYDADDVCMRCSEPEATTFDFPGTTGPTCGGPMFD